MRHYKYYADTTMRPALNHTSGEMVGKKPVAFSWLTPRRRRVLGQLATSVRMGKAFAKKGVKGK